MRDIFVCACTTDLSHESSFSRLLLLLFVVRQCAHLTCSPRRVWQNAWCCTSLQTASTRPPGGLPADYWIEKANRVELSSQAGRGNQSREKQSSKRQKMTTSVIGFIRRVYRTCVYIYSAVVFLSNPTGKRRFMSFISAEWRVLSSSHAADILALTWRCFLIKIKSFSGACCNRPPSVCVWYQADRCIFVDMSDFYPLPASEL